MQQRYYDPIIGRFYSNDPVDAFGHMQRGNSIAHGFNRYAYANNNPYKYTDPDGEFIQIIATGAAIGAAIGGVSEAYKQYQSGGGFDGTKIAGEALKGAVVGASSVGFGKVVGALGAPAGASVLKTTVTTVGGVAGAYVGTTINSIGEATVNAVSGNGFKIDFDPVEALGNMAGAAVGPISGAMTKTVTGSGIVSGASREVASAVATDIVKSELEYKK